MSYVWSEGVNVSVYEPASVSRVDISVDKTNVRVGEPITVTITAYLSAPAPTDAYIDFALAVNNTNNIVKTQSVSINKGATSASVTFQVTFDQPGTYTLYGGAMYTEAGIV